jgi:hypothetical protein
MIKQVWVLQHTGIEGNEIANELKITGSGQTITGPELANGSSDRTTHRPQGQGDLEESTGPNLYRTMIRGSVEYPLMKSWMILNRNQWRQVPLYLTGHLFKIGYHPKKAVFTMSTGTVQLNFRNRT